VDDEGNVAGLTHLVENGTLATYLHDSISAKHYGVKPTGNGRRESYKFAPMPRMRATYMLPGPHKKDEIIQSVKKGIYCTNFSNGQVKIGNGDFTFYVKNVPHRRRKDRCAIKDVDIMKPRFLGDRHGLGRSQDRRRRDVRQRRPERSGVARDATVRVSAITYRAAKHELLDAWPGRAGFGEEVCIRGRGERTNSATSTSDEGRKIGR
jgi:hypothetical protein